ncbi:hypothetical protein ACLOAU_04460 [Niabella sp. CJ426]|uniref:hypothetical protein n=1 Tax=Niabella sp. CJ426 TaxID=3393740 RepID=UPI003D059F13
MKNYHFNLQSKGGAGKSMLTYLQALKQEENAGAAFVDLDSASRTSSTQLAFLSLKNRVFEIEILDDIKRIDREKLFKVLEALNETEYEDIYIDFGSSESDQLLRLLTLDFTIDDFVEFEKTLKAHFFFNIVIAGGAAYGPSFLFLKKMTEAVKGSFPVYIYANEFTFKNNRQLIEELGQFVKSTKGLIREVRPFGDINTDRASGIEISANVKDGKGIVAYRSFAARIIINKELSKVI